jgi:hypothetical protein
MIVPDASLQLKQLQSLLEVRREAILHDSLILGVQADHLNWHLPVVVGNMVAMQKIEVPRGLARDTETRNMLREKHAKQGPTTPDDRFVRSPNQRRGLRAWRLDSDNPYQLMGLEFPDDPSNCEFIDGDALPAALSGFEQYSKHGWLIYKLFCDDLNLWMRWQHWQACFLNGTIGELNAFRVEFDDSPHPRPQRQLRAYLDMISPTWRTDEMQKRRVVSYLLRWFLWSLGHHSVPCQPLDEWTGRAHDRLCQSAQDFKFLMLYAYGNFTQLLQDLELIAPQMDMKTAKRIAKNLFPGRRNDYRSTLLVAPEAETNLLLAASNYTYELFAMHTDGLAAQAALLDLYIFAPWAVFPFEWLSRTEPAETDLLTCLSRSLEVMNAQKLKKSYFSATEPDHNGEPFYPIYKLSWKQRSIEHDITAGFEIVEDVELTQMVQLPNGMVLTPFLLALPLPPETKLQLPEITTGKAFPGIQKPELPQLRSLIELPEIYPPKQLSGS